MNNDIAPASSTPRARRRWVRRAALIGAPVSTAGLILATPLAAFALGSSPAPTPDATNGDYYANNTSVTVTSTGVSSTATYDVSLCTTAGFAPTFAPACTASSAYTISGTTLTSTVTVANGLANAHSGVIPGQPSTVDCTAKDSCYIVIATHSDGVGTTVDSSSPFRIQ